MSETRDVELLFEIGTMRFINRAWKQFLGANFANLAEHHFRVAWIAMVLAKMEGRGDLGKISQMALVHDLAECRSVDVHYLSRLYAERKQDEAVADTIAGTSLEKEITQLWREAEAKETIEAKIIKDADWLDVDLELREQAANGNSQEQIHREKRNTGIRPRLKTESAKRLYDIIAKSNPHDWHTNAKNRHTAGDWKN